MAPKFKRGGAGMPAIMSDPTPAPAVAPPAMKGDALAPKRDAVADEAVMEKLHGTEHRKPGRPRKTAAKPVEKDA